MKETFSKHRKDSGNTRVRKSTAWIDPKAISNDIANNEWDESYETGNVNFEITEDMDMALETEIPVQNVTNNETSSNNVEWEPVNIKCSKSPSPSVSGKLFFPL